MRAEIRQIFYDEATRRELDPGLLPLDNTANPRPDWFEFGVIRDFLLRTPLQEGTWYGFLSPKFRLKTGLGSADLNAFLRACDSGADVALFSPGWDQIAYFLNPFEQGEFWHPGLTDLSQQFLADCGVNLDLRRYVSHTGNTVYSNFVVAKPRFWREWLVLANKLFELTEAGRTELARSLSRNTSYGVEDAPYAMKAFLQERLAPVMLAGGSYRVAALDLSNRIPLFDALFRNDGRTRNLLIACDTLKMEYALDPGRDGAYLEMYLRLRSSIKLARPMRTPFV
jgi:hypothetical protein